MASAEPGKPFLSMTVIELIDTPPEPVDDGHRNCGGHGVLRVFEAPKIVSRFDR